MASIGLNDLSIIVQEELWQEHMNRREWKRQFSSSIDWNEWREKIETCNQGDLVPFVTQVQILYATVEPPVSFFFL